MKHKMWSRLLSMALAVMMIASIVPNSAFAEAASELAASSQVVTEMVEGTEEVTQPEETTGEEPAEQPAGETASDEEPVAEPSTEPAVESEQPTTEPTQAPAETAVPSEQPSAEPSAAPEGTQTPEGTAVPSETPAASATPAPSESPVPSETPAATEEPVILEEQTVEAVIYDSAESAQMEIMLMDLAQQEQQAKITLTGEMPKNAVVKAYPVNVEIESEKILAAYDITIYDEQGNVFQPENGAITVKIETPEIQEALAETTELNVYHMEDEQAAPEVVEEVVPEETAVSFEAESFSIYVVGKHYTHTYIFMANGAEYNKQILSTGEVLNQPKTPDVQDGQFFKGWYTAQGELFNGFGTLEGELKEDVKTVLTAEFGDAYYVFYKDENDTRVVFTQAYESGDEVQWQDVPYTPNGVDKAVIGWSTEKGAQVPDPSIVVGNQDITLYPVIATANWITYHSNGGSVVEPAYVLANGTTQKPDDPVRQGYQFAGWFSDEACTQEFHFGDKLTGNIDLYAKWNPGQSNYTVVYWLENADDKNYTYQEKVGRTGFTGEIAGYEARNYEHFTLDKEKTDGNQVVISGDGTTVKNVYYSRNEYTITFVKNNDGEIVCGKQEHTHSIFCYNWSGQLVCNREEHTHNATCYVYKNPIYIVNRKYDADISDVWSNQTIVEWSSKGYVWKSSLTGKYYSFLQKMPEQDVIMTATQWEGDKYTWDYYLEALGKKGPNGEETIQVNGKWYYRYHRTEVYGWGVSLTYDEDYFPITGFTQRDDRVPSFDYSRYARLFYTRNSYGISFNTNGGEPLSDETGILYEQNISNKKPQSYVENQTTKELNGQTYYFVGWYDNEAMEGEPFDFNTEMPAHDLLLYAKWDTKKETVHFNLNGGNIDGETTISDQVVPHGTAVSKPENPVREGYQFAGWTKNGKPFNFSTPIAEETTLVAQWVGNTAHTVTFNPGAGEGQPVLDEKEYAASAEVKLPNVPAEWKAPNGHTGFVYWSEEADGSGTKYYPGDTFVMPDHDVTLYAQWAPVRKTTLTYDYNYGTGFEEKREPVTIPNPNEKYVVDREATPPTGENWIFLGWYTEPVAEEGAELISRGDEIQVDTIAAESKNILYAQWQKTGTLTIEKTVEGLSDAALEELKNEISFTVSGGNLKNSMVINKGTVENWEQCWSDSTFTYNVTLPVTDVTGMLPYAVEEGGYANVTNYDWVVAGSVTEQANIEVTETTPGKAELKNVYEASIGDLTIKKKLESWNNFKGDEVTFIFKAVNKKDPTKVYYTTMTFTKNNYTVEQTKVLEDIPAGAYDVTELHTTGYVPTNEQYTVSASTDGLAASFVNWANGDKNPGDNGHANNQFTCDSEGNWTWKPTNGES